MLDTFRYVSVPRGEKGCYEKGWSINGGHALEELDLSQNIGLLTGQVSGWVVDVDLDCAEACQLAPFFLPETHLRWGRLTAPGSHYLYIVEKAIDKKAWSDPTVKDDKRAGLLEMRGDGFQTVTPLGAALHPSGQKIEFAEDGEPAEVEGDDLGRSCGILAAACLLKRKWAYGERQNAALALSGGLLRGGWKPEEVQRFLEIICEGAGDEELQMRIRAVESTKSSLDSGRETTGWPKLSQLIGEDAIQKMREWLLGEKNTSGVSWIHEYHDTQMGNGDRLTYLCWNRLRWLRELEQWIYWNGKYWEIDNRYQIYNYAKELIHLLEKEALENPANWIEDKKGNRINPEYQKHLKKETRGFISCMLEFAKTGLSMSIDDFDRHPYLVNCANGVVDIRDLGIGAHDPMLYLTRYIDYYADFSAKGPLFKQFHKGVYPDEEVRAFVKRSLGYSITGDRGEDCLWICYGEGDNGKSELFYLFSGIFGNYADTINWESLTRAMGQHNATQNDIAALRAIRFLYAAESDQGAQLDMGRIKKLVSEKALKVRYLYHEFFSLFPEFHIWAATNHLPKIKERDPATWKRINVLPYEGRFKKGDPGTIPHISDRILEEEPEAVLRFALEGANLWYNHKGLKPVTTGKVVARTEEYRREQDSLGPFFEERCEFGEDYLATAPGLYQEYVDWAHEQKYEEWKPVKFGKQLSLRKTSLNVYPGPEKIDGTTVNCWHGIRIKGDGSVVTNLTLERL